MGTLRRPKVVPGIYDEVVSDHLDAELQELDPSRVVRQALSSGDAAASPLATLLRSAVDLALSSVDGSSASLKLSEELLAVLQRHAPAAFSRPAELRLRPERLLAVVEPQAQRPAHPRGSLHTSSLIVNAEHESLLAHLNSEFDSADRVDLLCAFIKLSGFEKLRAAIERHCVERGRALRLLTTTYMGASDLAAIVRFARLPNVEVKVSYDAEATRLHAKAWVFHRATGFSTAYVGSSNLSHAAQTDGLEWNVRLTESDQPALVSQMVETFEQYWADSDAFERFSPDDVSHRDRLARALAPARELPPDFLPELEPRDFQRAVLQELRDARRLGQHRNLLVAATGTGKTVMAALDYRELRAAGAVDSLLFVAHRREILQQSQLVFRAALQHREFGELLFAGHRPRVGRHVFASIDSLGADSAIDPSKFDMVILDEAHHSAARTWDDLLGVIRPRELLGLTGTPERSDGLDYERHFPRPWVGNLRVWNAIPHALVPFRYYMVDVEGVDLRDVAWAAGAYAPAALAGRLIGAAEVFVLRAVRSIRECIGRPDELRALAFCVDVAHAHEVARHFEPHFRTRVLTGETPDAERRAARDDLDSGRVQVLCVVDLYNEGIDVPNCNTLFFFRPTESATVFLQQLGRGLRRARGKAELVVFDLTGRQHHSFRFDQRLRSMLGKTPRELRELVEGGAGFGRLPAGCHIQFDEVSRRDVLEQLERSIPSDLPGLRRLLREPAHAQLSLSEFLHQTEVELEAIYARKRSWTLLRRAAGLDARELADGEEAALQRVHKLIYVGDAPRLALWAQLCGLEPPRSEPQRRLMRMLFVVLYGKQLAGTDAAWALWRRHAVLREELLELATLLAARNAFLAEAHELEPDVPLTLHGRYLGPELSAAFDLRTAAGDFRDFYQGAATAGGGLYELLLVTLEKPASVKEHLRYRDFPLNERLFHWQSTASETQGSRMGRRLLNPAAAGCTLLLFVRESADDARGATMPFQYLGPVMPTAVSGERPITIEWALRFAMPQQLLRLGRIAT